MLVCVPEPVCQTTSRTRQAICREHLVSRGHDRVGASAPARASRGSLGTRASPAPRARARQACALPGDAECSTDAGSAPHSQSAGTSIGRTCPFRFLAWHGAAHGRIDALMNYTERYTRTAIVLHWIAAVSSSATSRGAVHGEPAAFPHNSSTSRGTSGRASRSSCSPRRLLSAPEASGAGASLPRCLPEAAFRHASTSSCMSSFRRTFHGLALQFRGGFQTVWFGVLPIPDLLRKDKESRMFSRSCTARSAIR